MTKPSVKSSETIAATDFEITDDGFDKYKALMIGKQDRARGTLSGIGAFLIGTTVWAEVVQLTGYKLDWMALAVGLIIGYAIRLFGKSVEPAPFGYIAGILAFFSSVIGNLLTACIMFSHIKKVPFFSLLSHLNPTTAFFFLRAVIGPFDVIFCIGAVLLAYYFSFKQLKGQ
jgi:hypothetical protein